MRKALAIAGVQLKLILRSRSSFIWLLLVPIIFTSIVGLVFGSAGYSAPADIPVALTDLDRGTMGMAAVHALEQEPGFQILEVSEQEGAQRLREGTVAALVVIPPGFTAALREGRPAEVHLTRSADASSGILAEQVVKEAMARAAGVVRAAALTADQLARWRPLAPEAREEVWNDAVRRAQEQMSTTPGVEAQVTILAKQQPDEQLPDTRTQTSTGFGAMFVMAGVLGAATALVSERLRGTRSRILATPTSIPSLLAGHLMAMMALGIVQFAIFVVWGQLVLHVDWGSNPPAVTALTVAYVFGATGIGILVGSVCTTLAQASAIATFVSYTTSMIAGCWWPVEIMPQFLQVAARAFPQYWAVKGFNTVIVRGLGFQDILPSLLALTATGAASLALGCAVYARRSRA